MAAPEIKLICLSNIFTRMMVFRAKGDVEQGHKHVYDHATLVSSGAVLIEMLDANDKVEHSKIFEAPNLIFVNKNRRHRLVALEDNTVCACIHAIRDVDEDIVDPDFLVEPLVSGASGTLPEMSAIFRAKTDKELQRVCD